MRVISGIAVSAGIYAVVLFLWSVWLSPSFVEFRYKDLIGQSITTEDFLRNNPDAFMFVGNRYEEVCGDEPESQNNSVATMRIGSVLLLPLPMALNTYLRVCFGNDSEITGLSAIREVDAP